MGIQRTRRRLYNMPVVFDTRQNCPAAILRVLHANPCQPRLQQLCVHTSTKSNRTSRGPTRKNFRLYKIAACQIKTPTHLLQCTDQLFILQRDRASPVLSDVQDALQAAEY